MAVFSLFSKFSTIFPIFMKKYDFCNVLIRFGKVYRSGNSAEVVPKHTEISILPKYRTEDFCRPPTPKYVTLHPELGHDRNYHTPFYHSNRSTPKYVTLHQELGHDCNYHTPSYHSNQSTPKYVTLHPELGHDRNYHTPSYHSNRSTPKYVTLHQEFGK